MVSVRKTVPAALLLLLLIATIHGCGNSMTRLARPAPPVRPDLGPPSPLRMEFKTRLQACNGDWSKTVKLMKDFTGRGPGAFALLLHVYYAESKPQPNDEWLRSMVEHLQAEDPFVRGRAAAAIIELGPLVRPRLEKALADTPLSNRLWLEAMVVRWETERIPDIGRSRSHFSIGFISVKDPNSLDLMAERVHYILKQGRPKSKRQQFVLRMLMALGRSGDDRYSDLLMPLLEHPDVRVAVTVVRGLGAGRNLRYIPPLLLKALESPRIEIAKTAIGYSTSLWGRKRVKAVRAALVRHFQGDNEELKFKAAFALMHDRGDPEATAYILSQTQSPDRKRARYAIGRIGDSCNSGKPLYPELLDALVPYLKSDDAKLRRAAAVALCTYTGQQMVWLVVPSLNDPDSTVSSGVFSKLRHHRHKQLVISSLWAYRHGMPEGPLRWKIDELLKALNAK